MRRPATSRLEGPAVRLLTAACVVLFAMLATAQLGWAQTTRHFTSKKAIWGPVTRDGVSQFPIYSDLGAGIWQYPMLWDVVAPTRPVDPTNPSDPAYQWPAELDQAVGEAGRYGISVSIEVRNTPPWANGGRPSNWVPSQPQQLADFMTAAARRYPTVHLWMIWGEPSRRPNFMPLTPEKPGSTTLTAKQAAAPRYYARLLDASYGALKAVSGANMVIGGNTFTTGDITAYNWVRYMRLPNGSRPRMDLYGHNPFTGRRPSLHASYHPSLVDFSDLPRFTKVLDRNLRGPGGRPLKLFLAEYFLPTDHKNYEFPFHVDWGLQASWLHDALAITERWSRIYTLGWYSLYDDPPQADHLEVNRGLITHDGRHKPSYDVYRRG